ncbi:thioesterase II family protein [Sodalis ligni]|uniref:thioesterase II family protein n=1 Tax=Sodalis ligni TaxID=2697027 RepID=UPI002097EA64|nr:alpha/beta fold hydrolase [Sodalis ligni]
MFHDPTDPAKLNLICLPYAGASADFYRRWQTALPGVKLHPVRLPGRGRDIGLPPIDDMERLTDLILSQLSGLFHSRFALLGTSMGGWIAFRLAQKLCLASGRHPASLFVCSAACPADRALIPRLTGLSDAQTLAVMATFNPASRNILQHPELASLFLPILRADFELCLNWMPDESYKLPIPIYGFRGQRDNIALEASMQQWQTLTTGIFRLATVPGDHFFIENPDPGFFNHLLELISFGKGDMHPRRE